MMRMTFFWTPDLGEFFFKGLEINSSLSLAILCGILAVGSILYEGVKVYTAYARARIAREQIAAVSCSPSESANLLITDTSNRNSFSKRFCRLINETIVFLFHNSLGYALMLSVMVYSGWLFLAVVLSMGLGYFFFGHISMKINMESIQTRTTKVVCSPGCPEAGNSGSNTTTPCHSGPIQSLDTHCTMSRDGCHDNEAMSDGQTAEKKSPQIDATADESCSCRL